MARCLVLLAAALLAACGSREPSAVSLVFHPYVGEEKLALNVGLYDNPGGEGQFRVRDFQFFVSNIRLRSAQSEYREAESYHLLRFDGGDGSYRLELSNLPAADYTEVEFGIGVDPASNGSISFAGDLDPNGRMAWSWDVGYKFVLFEGGLELSGQTYPLIYHIGFDENYQEQSHSIDGQRLDLCVDLLKLFSGASTVDLAALQNVKFDRADAARLAGNYRHMISPCQASVVEDWGQTTNSLP